MSSFAYTDNELARLSEQQPYSKRARHLNNDLNVPPEAHALPILSRPCASCGSSGSNFDCVERSSTVTAASAVCVPRTSTSVFAPNNSTTSPHIASAHSTQALLPEQPKNGKPAPILIPPTSLRQRDINRVPTPLSGRGDRKGHLFPFSRSPSPRDLSPRSCSEPRAYSSGASDNEDIFGRLERPRSASPASSASLRSRYGSLNMHGESIAAGRYPTSPLSPKPSSKQSLSPQNSQRRGNHGRQASRNMQLNLGRFHPSNFPQADASHLGMQAPQITYSRAPAPTLPPNQIESPRLLRQKHREFIDKAQLASKLAASPHSVKPDAPRLDPLGSPKGPVTPLELEDGGDYFSSTGTGKHSSVASPGSRSPRAASVTSDDETKPSKSRKIAM